MSAVPYDADSADHRTLPIGERLSGAPLVDDWLSCFEAVTLKPLGPLVQRVSAAVKSIPGVARTHFARWGDGSEHLRIVAESLAAGGGETVSRPGARR